MSEKLTIEGFAGLKKVSIDLRKINLFIGPQATGKSITAKLLHFFRSIPERFLLRAAYAGSADKELTAACLERFQEVFPRTTWPEATFSIRYACEDEFAQIEKRGGKTQKLTASWSSCYRELLRALAGMVGPTRDEAPVAQAIEGTQRHALYTELSRLVADKGVPELHFTQLFVPANRSVLAHVRSSIFGLLDEGIAIDPFLAGFGRIYDMWRDFILVAQRQQHAPMNAKWRATHKFLQNVLGGRHVVIDGEDFLEFPDGRVVDMAHASSGQQGALPLAIILQALLLVSTDTNGWSAYIEEPEAHLFPVTQRRIVEFMATVFNGEPGRIQFVVTTHSPYILTALNNLLQAGRLAGELAGEASALKRLHRVVPKTRLLSAGDVSAYYFDGMTARSIMTDDGLIEAAEIDSVSEDLAIQFGKILDIGG